MSARRLGIDWASIELDYRAGTVSVRAIAKKYGVSDAGILKRAKAESWSRDLKAKIRAEAERKVSTSAVSTQVSGAGAVSAANEKVIVDANATLQANLTLEQRGDIQALRSLVAKFQAQVERFAENDEDRDAMAQLMAGLLAGDDPKAVQKATIAVRKVLNTTTGLDCLDKLTRSYERVFKLQRVAFGISNTDENPEDTYETRLLRLAETQ